MLKPNKTRKQKKNSKDKIVMLVLNTFLLSDCYETCTAYVKHKNIEIFLLGISVYQLVSSLYKNKGIK